MSKVVPVPDDAEEALVDVHPDGVHVQVDFADEAREIIESHTYAIGMEATDE